MAVEDSEVTISFYFHKVLFCLCWVENNFLSNLLNINKTKESIYWFIMYLSA